MANKDTEKKNKERINERPKSGSGPAAWIRYIVIGIVSFLTSILGIFSWLIKGLLVLLATGVVCGCIVLLCIYVKVKPELDDCRRTVYDKVANMDEDDFISDMDTYIYDKDGKEIGLINAGNFEYADIGKISMNIQNIYISQEDKRFKEHMGVDWISTARAGLALIKNKGEITQGGSTITQQVIKNTYLTQEKSFKRKLIEIMMAPQMEQKFSKAKIMEYYCNTNYYGNRCYGVQAASQFYFGKDASDVSVAEAAMLAALSNSPSMYDPIKHFSDALNKRNKIIENFYNNGYITEEEKEDAIAEPLNIIEKEGKEGFQTYQSTYAIHCAALKLMEADHFRFKYTFSSKEEYDIYIEQYEKAYNEKTDEIKSGGYSIYTSLDSAIQEKLQNSIDTTLKEFDELQENGKFAMQGAAAVADNETGYIVAIVGGRGTDDQYNRAYLSARQPGSSIKPLIDYAPAFDTGKFYPSMVMNDHEIEDGPKNSGGGYRGRVTIREAVNRSINTVAWQVLQEIGVNNGLSYLGKMKFHKISYVDNDVAALSIGGFTNGVRVVDMVKGYQTLANLGQYTDRTCIVDIRDSNGNSVINRYKPDKEQVYDQDSAYMMTDILKGTIEQPFGTGRGLGLDSGMPSAGKTGTTNNNKDTWFCGYTRYYTTAVWVGYDIPREMPGIFGSTYSGRIWKQVMDGIHEGLEIKDWERPETVYDSCYDPGTGEATGAETGLYDIFSRSAQIRLAQETEEKERENLLAGIEAEVAAYEQSAISGPDDTYVIEETFEKISNTISKVEDASERKALYDRAYKKFQDLVRVRDSMKEEISLYEAKKAEEESRAAAKAAEQAEEERLAFIRKTREDAADDEIEKLEKMEYQPQSSFYANEARDAVEKLKEYDSYEAYYGHLETVLSRIKTLPSYEEYQELKAIRESEEASKQEYETEWWREGPGQEIRPDEEGPGASKPVEETYGPGLITDGQPLEEDTYGPGKESTAYWYGPQ